MFSFIMTLLYFHDMFQNMDHPSLKALVHNGPILPHVNNMSVELEIVTGPVQFLFFMLCHNSEVRELMNNCGHWS